MKEIKECPFCGNKARLCKNYERGMVSIVCADEKCTAMMIYPYDLEDTLVKAWNNRDYINPDGLPNGMVIDKKNGLLNWLGDNYVSQ